MSDVLIGPVRFGNHLPLSVIAGPCQLETRDHALFLAERLKQACEDAGVGLVFKASFDKANRTSAQGARGPGLEAGLEMLSAVKSAIGVPVITDVHSPDQCAPVAEVADALQIPAFLCRQTDLLVAAARTGRPVNVKKGQFLAPWDMAHVAGKLETAGNAQILLTERGTSFGYNTLVTDMRGLPQMAGLGHPVIMDATHAVQMPGGQGASSGGQRDFAPVLARAAVAVGVAGVFLETHQDPDTAPSDGPNMIPIDQIPALLKELAAFDSLAKARP
ncbi:3-deoxy-8-phosphooctulonate synthase [uncultured Aliiroseovarius sp.]|uniref:3-deoxy-8-phosphooctulonate synthase n=1 Tax=uncultured Aliiroseovarius sp. TaxID=1658783 RepID=UPI002636D050|nr:3-deoxy-8-phosphooctulonate synthase [uncultured Aliiroseovarius sp.]